MPSAPAAAGNEPERRDPSPHPRIAARRLTVQVSRVGKFDEKLRSALEQLSVLVMSETLRSRDSEGLCAHISELIGFLERSDPYSELGLFIRRKIANFLTEQQVGLDVIGACLILTSHLESAVSDFLMSISEIESAP